MLCVAGVFLRDIFNTILNVSHLSICSCSFLWQFLVGCVIFAEAPFCRYGWVCAYCVESKPSSRLSGWVFIHTVGLNHSLLQALSKYLCVHTV